MLLQYIWRLNISLEIVLCLPTAASLVDGCCGKLCNQARLR